MFDRCFRCGQPGHIRAHCPQKKRHPAAPASPAAPWRWKSPDPSQDPHAYPDDHYLLYGCAFCGAARFQPCINVGTGKQRAAHHSRLDLVKLGSE